MIPVIIVTFRNAVDAEKCLRALARLDAAPPIAAFICENGGRNAFNRLVASLTGPDGPCAPKRLQPTVVNDRFVQILRLQLQTGDAEQRVSVHVGEAINNLGYAGGVNAWLGPLLSVPEWPGVWILNPDTEPEPDALVQLKDYAARHGRAMVGSRLSTKSAPDIVHNRGLVWQRWRAQTCSVDLHTPVATYPSPDEVDRRLDAPSGASMYVTHSCVERIGLMDERYFLFFEDLDWGLRAKSCGGVGYAHLSRVIHEGGTTIGSSTSRRSQSPLAVYLEFRNRILFVRKNFALWMPWTTLVALIEIAEYARVRAFRNMRAAMRGLAAGVMGQRDRPNDTLFAVLSTADSHTK